MLRPAQGRQREGSPAAGVGGAGSRGAFGAPPARLVTLPWQAPGGKPATAALLFTTPAGQAINRHTWNTGWRAALNAAGIPPGSDAGTGFHQLRHHYASSLLAGGVDIKAVSEALGHHSAAFTLATYTHIMPSAHDRIRKAVDLALSADGTAPARKAGNP